MFCHLRSRCYYPATIASAMSAPSPSTPEPAMEKKPNRSRRRSPGWLELSVALAALIVSAASLYIARQQTSVMHRQLAATVWPAVQYISSNLRDGEPVITLSVQNGGVGPARLHRFRVTHQGRPVTDVTQFVVDCCAPQDVPVFTITSFVEGRILPAGGTIEFLTLPADPEHMEVYQRFDRVRGELEVELCYCSVLEECWLLAPRSARPEPVASCEGT
jgi:hypothetical protein